ncbi:hypothetical protein DFH11DRAFT_247288 [Phellopilus nigrolimitatus]|nr:hypothetical protein DFH11DRAFT_247288 [Phellopilus nigrolimitatus]
MQSFVIVILGIRRMCMDVIRSSCCRESICFPGQSKHPLAASTSSVSALPLWGLRSFTGGVLPFLSLFTFSHISAYSHKLEPTLHLGFQEICLELAGVLAKYGRFGSYLSKRILRAENGCDVFSRSRRAAPFPERPGVPKVSSSSWTSVHHMLPSLLVSPPSPGGEPYAPWALVTPTSAFDSCAYRTDTCGNTYFGRIVVP